MNGEYWFVSIDVGSSGSALANGRMYTRTGVKVRAVAVVVGNGSPSVM